MNDETAMVNVVIQTPPSLLEISLYASSAQKRTAARLRYLVVVVCDVIHCLQLVLPCHHRQLCVCSVETNKHTQDSPRDN